MRKTRRAFRAVVLTFVVLACAPMTTQQEVATHTTLERALKWLTTRFPPAVPEDLIPQDEFSYDLLVPYPGGLYLSYDTS